MANLLSDIGDILQASSDPAYGQLQLQQKEMQRKQAERQALIDFAKNSSLSPELAGLAQASPDLLPKILGMQAGLDAPAAVQNYKFRQNLPEAERANFDTIMKSQMVDVGYGYLDRATGNVIPKGVAPTREIKDGSVIDIPASMPGEQGITDLPATRNERSSLQQSIDESMRTLAGIKELRTHPGLESAVGAKGLSSGFGLLGEDFAFGGTDAAGFQARLKKLGGSNFLQAYQSLKGGGAITEVEGKKAEQAIANLATSQSEEDFLKSLSELEEVVNAGIERANKKLGRNPMDVIAGGSAPEGVEEEVWQVMTPEEKALWQK